ncbi:hypothetical protein BJ138DRAFT_1106378 [Hygrophoropsis aurantiaca]|uniref:Uncharacterized protein n=1 Tax=Hygrophoropsis aurantiaca TaxID=72124 RepID=A0ACB7ZUR7_9AGAM|nr:hypothetical protein BJ138DRAFT_1106378 [Hygrophoropsis aurantiaca]
MLFNLLTTALLCVFASTAAHAYKAHHYTVELTGKGGHKTNYHGTLPVSVPCDSCKSFKSASYNPVAGDFRTDDFGIKGNKNWELRFYKSSLCTDKHHLSPMLAGAQKIYAFEDGFHHLGAAHSFSVCRPTE